VVIPVGVPVWIAPRKQAGQDILRERGGMDKEGWEGGENGDGDEGWR